MFIPQHIRLEMMKNEPNGIDFISDIQFINIAYRPKPSGSATGGPNGVVKLLSGLIGEKYRGFFTRYIFEPSKLVIPKILREFSKRHQLGTMASKLLEAEYFVCGELHKNLPVLYSAQTGRNYLFLCHDIGSAVGAFYSGYPYVLIYHQQGGFAHERESFGEVLNPYEKTLMNHYEKIAFENAREVYFPSNGARKAFEKTSISTDLNKVNFASSPLYNSSDEFEISEEGARGFLISNNAGYLLEPSLRKNYLVFVTVGDYSFNKGLDRCPQILSRVAAKVDKKVVWIALGSKHKSGIYENLLRESDNSNFKSILHPERLPHNVAMGIVNHADWFLMQQRHSIFDFSSLEAMSLSKGLILSPVEGNIDFNKKDNVIFFDPESPDDQIISKICSSDPTVYGHKNKEIFDNFFNRENFVSGYFNIYNSFIQSTFPNPQKPCLPDDSYENIENLICGKEIIIMGAGKSAEFLTQTERESKTLVALNKAALLNKFSIDLHIMQDQPNDSDAWSQYLNQDTQRLYGKINLLSRSHLKIPFDFLDKVGVKYSTYNLDETAFDGRYTKFNFKDRNMPISDAFGVFFSAVQLCMIMGAKKIQTVGVDFSIDNFDGINPNKYSSSNNENLIVLLQQLKEINADFDVLHTTSDTFLGLYEKIFSEDPRKKEQYEIIEKINLVVSSNQSPFRQVQELAKNNMFKEVLFYLDTKLDPLSQMETRFMRERVQALIALEDYKKLSNLIKVLPEELINTLSELLKQDLLNYVYS